MSESLYRKIPSVNEILKYPAIEKLLETHGRPFVLDSIHEELASLREKIAGSDRDGESFEEALAQLETGIVRCIEKRLSPSLRSVVNATGVLVFTNAGRSPLAHRVMEKVAGLAPSYTNLEYDLEAGRRGHRDLHFEARVSRLLGCEAATVCNNAAAALLLALNTLASGREVLVSRGELIEIGGSFRLPAIMEKSGALLKEVGTTNKTKASDYESAIGDKTALILRVHPSNYRIVGFTQRPSLPELVAVSKRHAVPLLHDAGSGYLFRTEHDCLREEPVVTESLAAGADLVCFSGDKLLGGPQAGLIVGRRDLVARVRKNPLMRAMRVDKLIYSALEWTLMEYEKCTYEKTLPLWRMLSLPPEEVRKRAAALAGRLDDPFRVRIREGVSLTGGGSAPESGLPTFLFCLRSSRHSANQIEQSLRRAPVPILARIEEDEVVFDLRTVFPEQDELILSRLIELARA